MNGNLLGMFKQSNQDLEALFYRCLAQLPDLEARGVFEPAILLDTVASLEERRRDHDLTLDDKKQIDQWLQALSPDPEERLAGFVDSRP